MGGGGEKKKTNAMIQEQYNTNRQQQAQDQSEHAQFQSTVNPQLAGSIGRAGDMYSSMYGGYKDFIDGKGNFDPSKYGDAVRSGGGDGGGGGGDSRFGDVEGSYRNFMNGGGVDTGRFNAFQGNLMELAGSGGFDAATRANIMGDVGKMRAQADDQDIASRFRGGGVFDEFAKTGGYSDADISNIRRRANSVIPAYYDVARNEAGRMASVQGGYGPGQSALMARMSRDQARGAQSAALDAELGIKDKVNSGRQWGATGMSGAEDALQRMRLAALTGASGTEMGMNNAIAQNRTAAAGAGGSNETGMQGLIQKGKMFGTQGLEGMAESAAARGAASAAAAASDAKWRASFDREGQQFGLEGMKSLYGMAPGEVEMYLNANLKDRGLNNSNYVNNSGVAGGLIDQRLRNNPQRDWLSTIIGGAGAAGGLMSGIGAL